MSDNDSEPDPIKDAPLKRYVKSKTNKNAGSEALGELEAELLYIAEILWKEASLNAEKDDMKTVQKRHLDDAYDGIFMPHDELIKSSDSLKKMGSDMKQLAEELPVYKNWESYEE